MSDDRFPRQVSRQELMRLVRQARGRRKQTDVAAHLGVSQAAVSKAERDEDASVDPLRIRIIEAYTDLRVMGPPTVFTLYKVGD